jgi:hypothetical protein
MYGNIDNSILEMPELETVDYTQPTRNFANVDSVRSFNHFSFTASQYQSTHREIEAEVWACKNFGNYLKKGEIVYKGPILLQESFYVDITIELNTIVSFHQGEAVKFLYTQLPFSQNDHRFNRELLNFISSNISALNIAASSPT